MKEKLKNLFVKFLQAIQKGKKNSWLFAGLFLMLFSFGMHAHAATYGEQLDYSNTVTRTGSYHYNNIIGTSTGNSSAIYVGIRLQGSTGYGVSTFELNGTTLTPYNTDGTLVPPNSTMGPGFYILESTSTGFVRGTNYTLYIELGNTSIVQYGADSNNDLYYIFADNFNEALPPNPNGNTVSFLFPTQGQSTGLFTNWLMEASNLNASGSYEMQITWTATLPNGATTAPLTSTIGNFNFTSPWYAQIPRTDWSYNLANNATVTATANLLDSQDPNNPTVDLAQPIVVASTTINFTLLSIPSSSPSSTLATGGIIITTSISPTGTIATSSVGGFAYLQNNTSPTVVCTPPANILDVGGGIAYGGCQIINVLFNPDYLFNSTGYLNTQLIALENVPPFSAFFALANATNLGLTNFNNSTSTGVSIGLLGYSTGGAIQQNITTLNASSFYGGFSSANSSTVNQATIAYDETFIDAWLWIGAGVKILWIFTQGIT